MVDKPRKEPVRDPRADSVAHEILQGALKEWEGEPTGAVVTYRLQERQMGISSALLRESLEALAGHYDFELSEVAFAVVHLVKR